MCTRLAFALFIVLQFMNFVCGCRGGNTLNEQPQTSQTKVTDAQGRVEFSNILNGGNVQVQLTDLEEAPLSGVRVRIAVAGKYILVHATDDAGLYMPYFDYFDINHLPSGIASAASAKQASAVPVILIVQGAMIAWSAYGAGAATYRLLKDPPVFVEGEPGVKCVEATKENLADVAKLAGSVPGVIGFKFGNSGDLLANQLLNLYISKTGQAAIDEARRQAGPGKIRVCLPDPEFPYVQIEFDVHKVRPQDGSTDVSFSMTANGEYSGHFADISVENNGETDIAFDIAPGTTFANNNPSHQDMTVTGTNTMRIGAKTTSHMTVQVSDAEVFGACANLYKDAPAPGDTFMAVTESRSDLAALCAALDHYVADSGNSDIAQDAIWVITDQSAVEEAPVEQVRAFFRIAGLDPNNYTWSEDE